MSAQNKRKVIDLFTAKGFMEDVQNPGANDLITSQAHSHYLGVLPKDIADRLRKEGLILQARQQHLDEAVTQWEHDYTHHFTRLHAVLSKYRMLPETFDLVDDIMIDEKGHVYVLKTSTLLH